MPTLPVTLDYGSLGSKRTDAEQKRLNNISAVIQTKQHLWLASDEGSTIERLSWSKDRFADARSFELADYFTLPGTKPEIDIEGLSVADDRLWIAGSHSRNRKAPKDKTGEAEAKAATTDDLARLAEVKLPKRRYLLGCVKLSADHSKIAAPKDGSAPCIAFGAHGNALAEALAEDEHIAPFLQLPDKENGLDIEGLAVNGERMFLGLRGPVIGGYAIILELSLEDAGGALLLRRLGANGARYRKHFITLSGLGIRDLSVEGNGLLILAGPTMGIPGPWSVMHWPDAFACKGEGLVPPSVFRSGISIRQRAGDHPEGITAFRHPDGKQSGWLVVYDRPRKQRVTAAGVYTADFFVEGLTP